ncbi:MAG: hypothetical protein ACR2G5_09770 [Pyrinomonadaceae bacterium]
MTTLNLARKPFSNRALPWTVTSITICISLIAFFLIVRATGRANAQAYAVENDIHRLNQQEQAFRKQAQEVEKSLTAEQLQTLRAAHELVDRKRFSWSRLFADLEAALPGTVRVKRISVRDVAARNEQTLAELDLTVVAKTPTTITEMIADMDRTRIFQAQLRAQNLQKGRGESGTEYDLYVLYRPRAGSAKEAKPADLAANGGPR